MAWTRQKVREQASRYSLDPNLSGTSTAEVNAILDGIYATYGRVILVDRVRKVGTGVFVTFATNEYAAKSVDSNCVKIARLEFNQAAEYGLGVSPLEVDDFDAVVADSEHTTPSVSQRRFGAVKLAGEKKYRVAIFPPADGPMSFVAYGYCEVTPLTADADELDCDDADAENIARLLAFEIMGLNGEDMSKRSGVIAGVPEDIRSKVMLAYGRKPRQEQGHDQL